MVSLPASSSNPPARGRLRLLPPPGADAPAMARIGAPVLVATVELGGIELLDRLAPDWRTLCAEAGAEPFMHPDWLRTYVATRAPGARLAVVTARDDAGQLHAVLPLLDERVRLAGVPVRRWRSVGDLRSPERFDLLCRPADRDAAVAAVWDALRAARGWDLVELAAVPEGGAAIALREHAAASGAPVAARVALTTPVIALRARGGEPAEADAFAGTTAKFRANVRRRMRNLEQLGPVRLVRTERADEDLVEQFLAMEAAGWKGANGTAIVSNPDTDAFFRRMATVAADNGWLTLYALMCGDRPVAVHLGLTWGGENGTPRTYGVPKLTYDETLQSHAPGHLIVQEILRDLVARGVDTFDFLAADAPWKREWTDTLLTCERGFIFRRTPSGLLAHALRFRLFPAARQKKLALRREIASHRPLRLPLPALPSLRLPLRSNTQHPVTDNP